MGEDTLVVILVGLLIELAVLKAIVSWLLGSVWTEAIAQAEITTTGRAESLVTSKHITRTRYIHQVTASSTETLQGLLRKIRRERSSIPRMVQRSCQQDPTVPILEYDPHVWVTYSHSRALLSTIGLQTVYSCFDSNYPLDVRSRSN